ncbi:hypothetical protein ACHAQJ_004099 [Trichoderma viride]
MAADIDQESLQLSIHLQAQDAVALIEGKHRDDEQPPDVEFAAELYKLELQSLQTFYSDRALCHRLNDLGLEDGELPRGRANEEQPATIELENPTKGEVSSTRSSVHSTPAVVSVVDDEMTKLPVAP